MGTWGTGLYQDDLALDMKDYYLYLSGKECSSSNESIGRVLREAFSEVIGDPDDEPVYWLVLADLQLKTGCIDEDVKQRALAYIRDGTDLQRWSECSEKTIEKRKQVLETLEKKLLAPPKKRTTSQREPYCYKWAIGDVFALPIICEEAAVKNLQGRYFLFHFVKFYRTGQAVCRAKITSTAALPENEDDFNQMEYVRLFPGRRVPVPGLITADLLKLMTASKRSLPENMIYVGNYQNVVPPIPEDIDEALTVPLFYWKEIESKLLQLYYRYNL